VSGAVALTLAISAGLAAIGYLTQRSGVPDRTMFTAFLGLFAVYAVAMDLAWRHLTNNAKRPRATEGRPP
jgi:hypothetical protein